MKNLYGTTIGAPPTGNLTAAIVGPQVIETSGQYSWAAVVSGGISPYSSRDYDFELKVEVSDGSDTTVDILAVTTTGDPICPM